MFFFSLCVYVCTYLLNNSLVGGTFLLTPYFLLTYEIQPLWSSRKSGDKLVKNDRYCEFLKSTNLILCGFMKSINISHVLYKCNNILCIMKYAYLILKYANKRSIKNNLNMFK